MFKILSKNLGAKKGSQRSNFRRSLKRRTTTNNRGQCNFWGHFFLERSKPTLASVLAWSVYCYYKNAQSVRNRWKKGWKNAVQGCFVSWKINECQQYLNPSPSNFYDREVVLCFSRFGFISLRHGLWCIDWQKHSFNLNYISYEYSGIFSSNNRERKYNQA